MNTKTIMCILAWAALLASCVKEETRMNSKTGQLDLELASGVQFKTRSVDESAYQNFDSYQVTITTDKGKQTFSGTFATLRSRLPMELEMGSYTIEASFGTEAAASRSSFKVEGEKTFTIQPGKTISTSVDCIPTCGKVSAAFDADMDIYYSAYSVDFSGTQALGGSTFSWAKTDTDPYYVQLDPVGETLSYSIGLKTKPEFATKLEDGSIQEDARVTGTFTLDRNKAYKLNIKPNYTETSEGGLSIVITIDDSTVDHEIPIQVPIEWI